MSGFVPFEFGLRAITVRQPFASALVYGPKRIENRSQRLVVYSNDWERDARGDRWVAIHAGKELYDLDVEGAHWLKRLWPDLPMHEELLPMSALLGFARVAGWVHVGGGRQPRVIETRDFAPGVDHVKVSNDVLHDPFTVGPWCMVLDRMTPLATPIPGIRGYQGLWSVKPEHVEVMRGRYREMEATWA